MDLKTQRNLLGAALVVSLIVIGVLVGTGALSGGAGGTKGRPDGFPANAKGVGKDQNSGYPIVTSDEELALDPAAPGTSVVGDNRVMNGLSISSNGGNDIKFLTELTYPLAYGANLNGVPNVVNACSIPGGAIADMGSAPSYSYTTKQHDYVFTFNQGPVSYFQIGVLDWGDFLPYGAPADGRSALVMTAYNANNEVVDVAEMSFTTGTQTAMNGRTSDEFGNLSTAGDACDTISQVGDVPVEGQGLPGRFIFSVQGAGITHVEVAFANKASMDPNMALWVGAIRFSTADGTGTIGYWMNRGYNLGWPVTGSWSTGDVDYSLNGNLVVGGVEYAPADALAIMQESGSGDYSYQVFQQLAGAKLNVLAGNDASCIVDTIAQAEQWLIDHPVGSGADPSTDGASDLNDTLTQYNEGSLCAPHRDS